MNDSLTQTRMSKKELWERIKNYKFNDLVPKSTFEDIIELLEGKNAPVRAFANKIMKKHRLPRAFTFRAVEEYKKFVYLGVISDFVVTPSKYIDLIWHEHLLFSKAYREFCNEVIHYQFDHQPELVTTEAQTELYTVQYLETLDLYRKEFGMEPPDNIWGTPKFNKERIDPTKSRSAKKYYESGSYYPDIPLYTHYDEGSLNHEFSGFDGGDFGGGGAGGDWGDSSGGGDSGGSCSSCSGGCGGGGD
jgi:hypothetical protein